MPDDVPVLLGELMPDVPQPLPTQVKLHRQRVLLQDITVESIDAFLRNVEKTGLLYQSAEVAGLSYATIKRLRADDDVFKTMIEESMQVYKESLEQECHERAVNGWDEPVYSQRTGELIGHIRRKDPRLLELMLKRHIPEYREKFEGTVNVTGGVLVAPVAPVSPEDWQKKFGGGDQIKLLSSESQGTKAPGETDSIQGSPGNGG